MGNFAINGLNQAIYTAGNLQGAAATMGQAAMAVDQSFQRVASVFTGDQYQASYPYPAAAPIQGGEGVKTKIMGLVGSMIGGGLAGGVTHQQTADALRSFKSAGIGTGVKALGLSTLKSAGIGAAVTGVISGVQNFGSVARGNMSAADAGGNVAADTIGGLIAGSAGGLSAGIASLGLSALGATGLAVTIGAVAAGAIGGVSVNRFYLKGTRDEVAGRLREAFGGTPQVPQPNQ